MEAQRQEKSSTFSIGSRPKLLPGSVDPDLVLEQSNRDPATSHLIDKPLPASVNDAVDDGWEDLEREPGVAKGKWKASSEIGTMEKPVKSSPIPPPSQPITVSPPTAHESQSQQAGHGINTSYSTPTIRPKNLAPNPYRPQAITSYRKLFNISGYDDESFCYDKTVLLQPFDRLVFVVQATFDREDFHRWAWLLAQSEERWYTMPSTAALARMRVSGLTKRKPVTNPKPTCMRIPSIVASDSLYLDTYGEEVVDSDCWGECELLHHDDMGHADEEEKEKIQSDGDSEDEGVDKAEDDRKQMDSIQVKAKLEKWGCKKCYKKNLEIYEDVGWIYLSVVRADRRQSDDAHEGDGTGMFMLRKSGSREQAAARAFHDAGALGWSTLFCCAIRADVELLAWKGKVEKVINSVHRVLIQKEGVLRVFL